MWIQNNLLDVGFTDAVSSGSFYTVREREDN
jgi:hypothetical protein